MATRKNTKAQPEQNRRLEDTNTDAAAIKALATVADKLAETVAAHQAPKTVALRGGAAVSKVKVKEGAKYNTKAEHNMKWWNHLMTTCKDNGAAVTDLTKEVPAHFIGYCLRRGYLEQA